MRIGILCSEKTWLVEQIEFFLNKNNVASGVLLLDKLDTLNRVNYDYVIVRGGPGLKEVKDWEKLLRAVKSIEEKGIKCINSSDVIKNGIDKYSTYLLLKKNKIPTPASFLLSNAFVADRFPVVVKPVMGSEGSGLKKVEIQQELDKLKNSKELLLVQGFIPHGGIDYRAYVVGNRVVGGISRSVRGWITNLARGGVPEKYVLSKEEEGIANNAAAAIRAEIATVDFAVLEKNGKAEIHVFEVNVLPLFSNVLEGITGFNLAEEIVKYLLEKYM